VASSRRDGRQQITLARALSKLGLTSRSQAVSIIRSGRVRVGAEVVTSPSRWVDPRKEKIAVDGVTVRPQKRIYLMMHKPAGYVTTRADELHRATVYALLPREMRYVFPVGRLDRESSGLLLFTNDTEFGDALTRPGSPIEKTYEVQTDLPLTPAARREMESGMTLKDGTRLLGCRLRQSDTDARSFWIVLREGKNRQIRRMCEQLGLRVVRLHRVSVGPLALGRLAAGSVRPLTQSERRLCAQAADREESPR